MTPDTDSGGKYFHNADKRGKLGSRLGPPVPSQYVALGADQEVLKDVRAMTSGLGRLCESTAIRLWSGAIEPILDRPGFTEALEIRSRIILGKVDKMKGRRKNAYLSGIYQQLLPVPEIPFLDEDNSLRPSNIFTGLFKDIDSLYGTRFYEQYQSLGIESRDFDGDYKEVVNSKIRYLIEGALILARLTVNPSPFKRGRFEPNKVILDSRKKPVTQFDGVIVPKKNRSSFNLVDYWNEGVPHEIVLIKTPFRARQSGPKALKQPPHEHIVHFQDQIGRSLVALDMPRFPESLTAVHFVYLRGSRDHVIHTLGNKCRLHRKVEDRSGGRSQERTS